MMKKIILAIAISLLFITTSLQAASVTKGLIGKQDNSLWDGTSTKTFTRTTLDGYSLTLNQIDWPGVDVLQVYGGGVNRTLATLVSAKAGVGATNKVSFFLSPGTWTITDDLTITANIYLIIPPGAELEISSGKTLTIYNPANINAARNQKIKTGAGKIAFTIGGTLYPEWWGMPTDGTDGSTELQAVVDSAESAVTGSEIWFNPGSRYGIATTVDIQVSGGVSLRSNMGPPLINRATGALLTGAIVPVAGGDLTEGMIRFLKPTGADASYNVSGLAFIDASNLVDAGVGLEDIFDNKRAIALKAALNLDWFSQGTVENCHFHILKGSGIRVGTMAKGNIINSRFEYCGNTSQPALFFDGAATNTSGQNLDVSHNKFEHNYYASHIEINAFGWEIRTTNNGFEGYATAALGDGDSIFPFITNAGTHNSISENHFNTNGAETYAYIVNTGAYVTITKSMIYGDCYKFLSNTGDHLIVDTVTAATGVVATNHDFINSSGAYTVVDNISLKGMGRITLGGAHSKISNSILNNSSLTTGPVVEFDAGADYSSFVNSSIRNTNDDVAGIHIDGSAVDSIISHSQFDSIGDTGVNTASPIEHDGAYTNIHVDACEFNTIYGTVPNIKQGTNASFSGTIQEFGPYSVAASGSSETFIAYITFKGIAAIFGLDFRIAGIFDTAESVYKHLEIGGALNSNVLTDSEQAEISALGDAADSNLTAAIAAAGAGNILNIIFTNANDHAFSGTMFVRPTVHGSQVDTIRILNNQ